MAARAHRAVCSSASSSCIQARYSALQAPVAGPALRGPESVERHDEVHHQIRHRTLLPRGVLLPVLTARDTEIHGSGRLAAGLARGWDQGPHLVRVAGQSGVPRNQSRLEAAGPVPRDAPSCTAPPITPPSLDGQVHGQRRRDPPRPQAHRCPPLRAAQPMGRCPAHPADGTRYLKTHTWEEYGAWHLGLTEGAGEETKRRYAFVLGDFRRCTAWGSSPATTGQPSGATRTSS